MPLNNRPADNFWLNVFIAAPPVLSPAKTNSVQALAVYDMCRKAMRPWRSVSVPKTDSDCQTVTGRGKLPTDGLTLHSPRLTRMTPAGIKMPGQR